MDKVIQRLFVEYGIEDGDLKDQFLQICDLPNSVVAAEPQDRTSGVITNWYPDGQGNLGSHRHDCWTALFSFGHERILTIDNTPLLMQDGDLCIFGTQRHGVPIMPEITDGRITLVVFFYPDKMQKKGMWQTITDPETMENSRPLGKMLSNHSLSLQSDRLNLHINHDKELLALQQLGASHADATAAWAASGGDLERAAELLLMAGSGAFVEDHGADAAMPLPEPAKRGNRFQRASAETVAVEMSDEGSLPSTAAGSAPSADTEDEILARRLQAEEEEATLPGSTEMSESELAALALHLEEVENANSFLDPSLLAAQFQEYEAKLTMDDAEKWNGQGDLMHSPFSREQLSLEKMDPVTIYSVGHGDMLEKDFWEMLQCHSVRVLYDIRPTDHRGELFSRHQRFSVSALRLQCRSRGIFFKSMPVGREAAYGTLAHIRSDEGRHTLVELAWQAKRKRTAFMGSEELWSHDNRQVLAEELTKGGHTVEHVRSDGSTERHAMGIQYPDWLVREEERLKLLEKKREAGEAGNHVQKSRIQRSSEAVAARLARPVEEMDAMAELRNAANQRELVVAQRKLARYQRLSDEKGLLANKVLKNVPEWIREDAAKQAEWVAAKKKEKAEREEAGGNGSKEAEVDGRTLEVEAVRDLPGLSPLTMYLRPTSYEQRDIHVVQATVVQGNYNPGAPGNGGPGYGIQMGQPIGTTQVIGQPIYVQLCLQWEASGSEY
ncbi:BRIX1 [Symbiodinium microadriaticum]|nr:BRIX1 [Symbiodinium microadriaticum]